MDIQSGRFTEVNPNILLPKSTADIPVTKVNTATTSINNNGRVIVDGTVINPSVTPFDRDPSSDNEHNTKSHLAEKDLGLVFDGYRLVSVIGTTSGEADLYICEDDAGCKYCLKHYKRLDSISKEVHTILQNLRGAYIAKLVSWGYWDERIYEVWPFFANGSLSGQHPDAVTLKRYVKQMNEAIATIHQNGIVHQDIKPANFMVDDNGDVALIDFGTSAIISSDTDQRTHVTKVGQTTDYASPEVLFSRYCWPVSDYYSLGVTIYELLLGTTPYAHYDEDMLQRKIDDMRNTHIPNIDKLSKEYQELIKGLLWYDKELRWGYEQICDWLAGNYSKWIRTCCVSNTRPLHEKQFRFDKDVYLIPSQMPQLIVNMAYQWDMGKNLFDSDGRFIRMCKTLEDMEGTEDLYSICNAPKSPRGENDNINYFKKLYRLSPELKIFAWKNWHFKDKKALGEAILNSLWASEVDKTTNTLGTSVSIFGDDTAPPAFPSRSEIIFWVKNHIISQYLQFIGDQDTASIISSLEYETQDNTLFYFRIAYKLSCSTKLRIPSGEFNDKTDFLQLVEKKVQESEAAGSVDAFLQFCRSEIYDGQTINAGFQAWVESLGLEKTLGVLTGENKLRFEE